jgi:hypothetical protein
MLLTTAVQATILTFDELPPPPGPKLSSIPDGYGGFDWTNFNYHLNDFGGFKNGCVSPSNVAFNWKAGIAKTSDGLFDFTGAYFTGAWNDDLNITVEGYLGPTMIYTKTVVADYYYPTWYTFDFLGVDALWFSSSGGYDVDPLDGWGTHFVMDNFTFVPEPATIALLGLGALSLLRRKR